MLVEKITTKKKLILFRVDLSEKIGLGHFIRCLNLAQSISNKGNSIVFIFNFSSYKSFLQLGIQNNFSFKVFVLSEEFDEVEQIFGNLLENIEPELLVVDNYSWGVNEEKKCRPFVKNLLIFDDLANRKHDCDILVDVSFKRKKKHYQGFVSKSTKLLLGPEYAPLNPLYYKLRKKIIKRDSIKNILISFGGTDPHNITSIAMNALNKISSINKITIILNNLSSNFDKIQKLVESNKEWN